VKRFVIEYYVPLVLWLLLIFFFSTDTFSSGETSRIIVPLLRLLAGSLSSETLDFWHAVIRKLGHITEYFVLAFLTYRSVKHKNPNTVNANMRTFGCVVFAAAFDELHQRFTVFRTASPIDVGYDCFGAVWALWLIATYETRRLRTRTIL
jgi:VanZ family protein